MTLQIYYYFQNAEIHAVYCNNKLKKSPVHLFKTILTVFAAFEWSTRYGAIAQFENHFDLQVAQDFYYDRKNGRRIQFVEPVEFTINDFYSRWRCQVGLRVTF